MVQYGESKSSAKSKIRPFGFNQILYDFGLPFKDMNDEDKVQTKIEEIDESFDLIVLADKEFFNDLLHKWMHMWCVIRT